MDKTILVLPGGPGVGYEYLRPELAELEPAARLIFFDRRSTGPFALFLEDVESLCADLHLERVVLLGHSFGGLLAMRYVMEHPERIEALILIDPDPASRQLWARYTEVMTARPAVSHMSQYFASGRAPEGFESRFPQMPRDDSTRKSLADWDFHHRLGEIHCPALIVTGDRSIFPLEAMERLRAGMRNASLAVMSNASHFPQVEAREEFLELVGRFLDSLSRSGASSEAPPPKR